MTPIILQLTPPTDLTLSPEELQKITGAKTATRQLAWLRDHDWPFELDAAKGVQVGKLYAHLRLAGLTPAAVAPPTPASQAAAAGFDLSKTR